MYQLKRRTRTPFYPHTRFQTISTKGLVTVVSITSTLHWRCSQTRPRTKRAWVYGLDEWPIYLIGNVRSFCRCARTSFDRYSHLNTKFQSNPPLSSDEAPMYWKLSMLITSMMGHTTLVGSCYDVTIHELQPYECPNTLKAKTKQNKAHTSATRSKSGSSQLTLHSTWLSKNVSTGAVAMSAPRTLDLINPAYNLIELIFFKLYFKVFKLNKYYANYLLNRVLMKNIFCKIVN